MFVIKKKYHYQIGGANRCITLNRRRLMPAEDQYYYQTLLQTKPPRLDNFQLNTISFISNRVNEK